MGIIDLKRIQMNTILINDQLNECNTVEGKMREFVKKYMIEKGIYSLENVTLEDFQDFREYVDDLRQFKMSQKKHYRNLLERVTCTYLIFKDNVLKNQVNRCITDNAVRNKVYGFLLVQGITDCQLIDYNVRCAYKTFLYGNVATSKVTEYIKALDILKLTTIKIENELNPMKDTKLKYANKKVFLLYHPSYALSMTFYYVRNKEELMFDFSVGASIIMKKQIFKMLNHVLETKKNWHDRRERFLIPLKLFYQYCISAEIEDIEQITEQHILEFRKSIDGKVGTKTDTYMQLIDNIRKFLFLDAKDTNWKANVWYLERFIFPDGRTNPAREIKKITFGEIVNEKNRSLMKEYMKYQLGVTAKASLQTIRCQYYDIISYIMYLDEKGTDATVVTGKEMEAYIYMQGEKDVQPESFNRSLISIARFYGYLVLRKVILKPPLHFEYYIKHTYIRHNNRSVAMEDQFEILKKLNFFPLHLRLMYLNLWCVGLRVSEVCVIKGNAYYWDGQDAWIRIYQNKMKNEKCVPIPTLLYELMKKYIEENNIRADEYVFQNRNGGAYNAGTFSKQFQKYLKEAGIEDYNFKSHDFRHTVATYLYSDGASIEIVRDYLGHKESDMTRSYIDYMSEKIDEANEEYFTAKPNKLAQAAKKKEDKKNG